MNSKFRESGISHPFLLVIALASSLALSAVVGIPNSHAGAIYYVSLTGSDTTGDGSSAKPWGSIGFGYSRMIGGDTLIVKNGVYTGQNNFIGRYGGRGYGQPPNGSPGAYTVIRAETPFGVRINKGTSSPDYEDSYIRLINRSYILVEGFVVDHSGGGPESTVSVEGSNHVKVKKLIVKRSGITNDYDEVVATTGSSYVLWEDCALVGQMRYGFYVGGPSDTSQYIIYRRCVVRNDYTATTQPKASFCVYGNNSGYGAQDILFQNCIVIDSHNTGMTGGERTYGGWYNPKNAKNVTWRGCIALKVDSYYAAIFAKEQNGTGMTLTDTVMWDSGPTGDMGIQAQGSGAGLTLNRCTIGGNGTAIGQYSSGTGHVLKNTLFYNNGALYAGGSEGWNVVTNNGFYPVTQAYGTNAVTQLIFGKQKYILRVEADSGLYNAGDDGGNIGATIVNRWGADGTLWGEAGYDSLTGVPVWPWPYQDQIKAVFSESNPPPTGAVPSTNDTQRGFCATGQTLTNYIWSYLGNPTPPEYTTSPPPSKIPAAPQAIRVN
ncbi:hypothetical protein HZA56_18735 [Candidatus Poribacteria bacterium]|nr:hypothetical protein [Candidatus Poribacteria bacterium]